MKTPVHHACLVNGKFIYSSYRQAVAMTDPALLPGICDDEAKERIRERKRGWGKFKQTGRVIIGENEYKAIENGQSVDDLLVLDNLEKEKARSVIYRWKNSEQYWFDASVIEKGYEGHYPPDRPDEIGAFLRLRTKGPRRAYQLYNPVAIIEYPNRATFNYYLDGPGVVLELDGTKYTAQEILSGCGSEVLVLWASERDEAIFRGDLRPERDKARSVIYRWKTTIYQVDADVIRTDYLGKPGNIRTFLRSRSGPCQLYNPVAIIEYPNGAALPPEDGSGWRLELDVINVLRGCASQVLVLWASKKDEEIFHEYLREFDVE